MSSQHRSPFDDLSSELIYRIFDYLDSVTILLSLRRLSKLFYKQVHNYNRLHLHLKDISQNNFLFLLNYSNHQNIRSLTFTENEQTPGIFQLFLSICRFHQFNQLQSLIIEGIDQSYFDLIIKDIQQLKLRSLNISSNKDYSQNDVDLNHFSSLVSFPTLRRFSFDIPTFPLSFLRWPIQSNIKSLEINCSRLFLFFDLVRHLNQLDKLVLLGLNEVQGEETYSIDEQLKPFNQLKSLIIKNGSMDLFILQKILFFTPTLIHLQLIKSIHFISFVTQLNQLETFFQSDLLLLNRFQFHLSCKENELSIPIESLVDPFRRSYWIDQQKCFVECIHMKYSRTIHLFTPPLFDEQFIYQYQFKDLLSFQSNPKEDNYSITNQIKSIRIDLVNVMNVATSPQVCSIDSFH